MNARPQPNTGRNLPPIPLVDLATQSQQIRDEVLQRMARVIDEGRYILGQEVAEFETQFAQYCQVPHCVGVANGTDALHLALKVLGIGPGDEVITVGNSFAATAFAIAYTGATAVLVDIDPQTYNIDANLVEEAVTSRTRAILPVHLYGHPAPMREILDIAGRHNLRVVEDCAQSHGAEISGQRCGSFGDIGCFSFYPGKNLGAFGDGGGIVTRDPDIAEQLTLWRNYGQKVKNRHDLLGFNCRLDTLQACVLLTKMQYIQQWTEQRRQVAAWYTEELRDTELELPSEQAGYKHVYHLYVVRHRQRDRLSAHLAQQNIACGVHYPNPLYRAQPFHGAITLPWGLPVCSQYSNEILSLPLYPEMTRHQVERVAEGVRTFVSSAVGKS
ncbi:MAG: DegT/DnrJ/EryC1/StrS family aminotransferase [Pirellulaceae bacterium]|nr:DegT/DnrJ/EryC1/StrS family aminotransferase [Pirellulaceae bacterium]